MPTRRTFLASTAAAATASADSDRKPENRLGLDFFSVRSQGWSAFELLDFAQRNGCQVAHFSEPRFLGSLEEHHLHKVRAHADQAGLEIEIGLGSICPTSSRFVPEDGTAPQQLRRMLRVAEVLGSKIVRCYLGGAKDRSGETPLEAHIENTVASCKAVREDFLRAGVKIAIENHAGDLQALQLKELIEAAGPDYVGALLDAGNAAWTLEDPWHTLETLAPYALTTGVRDSAIWLTADGAAVLWVPLGKGVLDVKRWFARLSELRPDLTFALEMINLRSPRAFDYRKPEFWQTYRDVPAWVFAGFENLAQKGEPYEAPQPPEGVDAKQWARDLERSDCENDLRFCREELGLGG